MSRETLDREALPYRPCVGLMILNEQGLVFSGRRIDRGRTGAESSSESAWQMPQGGVDPGEDAETAALRELGEETGLEAHDVALIRQARDQIAYDLPDALLGKIWGGRFRGQIQTWFAFRLTSGDDAIDIATDEPEFDAWAWKAADDLLTHIVPFKRDVYRAVFREFDDLIGKSINHRD